jgi:hypothetical protein
MMLNRVLRLGSRRYTPGQLRMHNIYLPTD